MLVWQGSLRFSRKPALAQLATLKQSQASSGFHCDARLRLRGVKVYPPVALTEYRSQSGEQARTMFEGVYGAKPRKSPSCAWPPDWRGTQGTGVAGECSGGHSLWVLSLGQARESTSQCGRESPHLIKGRACKALYLSLLPKLIRPSFPLIRLLILVRCRQKSSTVRTDIAAMMAGSGSSQRNHKGVSRMAINAASEE